MRPQFTDTAEGQCVGGTKTKPWFNLRGLIIINLLPGLSHGGVTGGG